MKEKSLWRPVLVYALAITAYQPINQAVAKATGSNQQGIEAFALQYSGELIAVACIFLLLASSIIGVFYPTPVYGGKPIPLKLKAPICVVGGFCAFLYCLHIDKALTLLTPIWVGAMSFIAPAIIHLVHALLIKHFGVRFGVDQELLDQIQAENPAES